jgi:hypothetical protein
MTGTRRYQLLSLILTGLAGIGRSAFATPSQTTSDHVRAGNALIATLIQHAGERSNTFRRLLDTINASDGIVYIEPGTCGHGIRACFVKVTMAGPTRLLWVMVDTQGDDCDLMGLVAHELQHTIEVLSNPSVTSPAAMYFFYSQEADAGNSPAFETNAAKRAGEAVRAEVRQNSRCIKIR